MEAYKTTCPECGYVRFWTGYKTGIGKTPEQLQRMRKDAITCTKCKSVKANTELDRESEQGKIFDEMDRHAAGMIADLIKERLSMIDVLLEVEQELPRLLAEKEGWQSLLVDDEQPMVERVWRPWRIWRVHLHRIHTCAAGEALFHPHPWPSAMRVLSGSYEMEVGRGPGLERPPVMGRTIIESGMDYEMTHPDAWHSVRPIDQPVMSLMVTGSPWSRPKLPVAQTLRSLEPEREQQILDFFKQAYGAAAPAA